MKSTPQDLIRSLRNDQWRWLTSPEYRKEWSLDALSGSMIEISGDGASARTTIAAKLTLEAQERRELVAWIVRPQTCFFPPDMAAAGIDLEALIVICLEPLAARLKAVEYLLRSKAFGLIVVSMEDKASIPSRAQLRFASCTNASGTVLLFLTAKPSLTGSLGFAISTHGHVARTREQAGAFRCALTIEKDKRRGSGWTHEQPCFSQDGLC